MTQISKAQREAELRLSAAFEAGYEYFATCPDEILTVINRYASATYPVKDEAFEFVLGYSKARERYDQFQRERSHE